MDTFVMMASSPNVPLSGLLLAPLCLASAFEFSPHHTRASGISWKSCDLGLGATEPMSCANLTVPLDYSDPQSTETLQLSLVRVAATKTPSNGSILLNFGGPGASGYADFSSLATRLLAVTGGTHDLINFVPRGTNETIPFSCYATAAERTVAGLISPILSGNASDVATGRIWADSQVFAETCLAAQNDTGSFVGSAYVARDMMQIVDALGEDGMLRYWGVSYGSLLGATAAAMFPKKMDKVILDGVVNPHEYYANREVELFTDTDKVFSDFCAACVASPTTCSLATGDITGPELEAAIYAYFDNLKFNPFVITSASGPVVLDYSTIKPLVHRQMYDPTGWPTFAIILQALLSKNLDVIAAVYDAYISAGSPLDSEAQYGIKCSDSYDQTSGIDDILPTIYARHKKSRIAGDTADAVAMRCAEWTLPAKERYNGTFSVKTEKPLLIIGNTYDPVTPLVSARNVSESFGGSVLLQHGAHGHTSLLQGSVCTAKAIRSYFTEGELPAAGTLCNVTVSLFSGSDGWDDVLTALAADSGNDL